VDTVTDEETQQEKAFSNVEKMLQKAMTTIPKKYLNQQRQQLRFWVNWEVWDAYHETLRRRNGQITSDPQTGAPQLDFKGIRLVQVPMLDRSTTIGAGGAGRVGLLSSAQNMVWGVFRRVIVERDRIPKKRRTDFVLTFWGDADFEDADGAVSIYLDKEKP
jgi:hypothetical protein